MYNLNRCLLCQRVIADGLPCPHCAKGVGGFHPVAVEPTYTPAEVEAVARAAYRAGLEDARQVAARQRGEGLDEWFRGNNSACTAIWHGIISLPVPADILSAVNQRSENSK